MTISVLPVDELPEIRAGDVVSELLVGAVTDLRTGDVVVVAAKIVSKAEGRLVADADDLVEREAVRVLRRRGDAVIAETAQGFVCTDAGVSRANVEPGWAALLPLDADRSARRLRDGIRARAGVHVGVIVADGFDRPWRDGRTGVALGCAGVAAVVDGVCVADELASAAHLVRRGVAIVRGVDASWLREAAVADEVVGDPARHLFR